MQSLLKTVQAAGRLKDAAPETLDAYRPAVEVTDIMTRKCTEGMPVIAHLNFLSSLARAMEYLLECSVAMCRQCLVDSYASSRLRFLSDWKDNAEWKVTLGYIENHQIEAVSLGLKTRFPPHPKLQMLNELLGEHLISEASDETRALVLTGFRANVDEVVAHLNANGHDIRASSFIGQTGGINGLNQKEQATTISHFRSGKLNVLVMTSINEGLDIGEIDLVVCYDARGAPTHVPKLIGQKRGVKFIVLLAKGREERSWDKAEESNPDTIEEPTTELFNDAANITPKEPRCVEKILGIEPYNREVLGTSSGKRSHTEPETCTTSKRKRAAVGNRKTPEGALISS
ncbi:3'-5' DNA helicase [Ceratobasidium sp. 395]|nr:3'-5' DNA helicase [Ceratobasidium sp. 395]